MSLYQSGRRFARMRTYFIIFVVFAGMIVAVARPMLQRLAATCPEPPMYAEDVPPEIRAEIDALYDAGLLYCSNPEAVEGLATVNGRVYWGSDGVSSVLYFPADSLDGVGVTRYGTGSDSGSGAYNLGPPGAAAPPGFAEDRAGRTAWTNQAPDGASFFYRFQGAPTDIDSATAVDIKGPAAGQTSLSGRDVFRDLEILWAWVRRQPEAEVGSTTVRIPMAIVPERWSEVRSRAIDPELLNEDGDPSYQVLREMTPAEPSLYQVVSGPLGTTVWVAGTISGTKPALVLVGPDGDPALQEPFADAPWASDTTDVRLHHFAFEPVPSGGVYEALFWHDEALQASEAPDYTWTASAP